MSDRIRTIHVAGINVAMHQPHSPARYIDAMALLIEMRAVVQTKGVHAGMIGSVYGNASTWRESGEARGEFFSFLRLDPNEPWFNSQTKEVATDDDRSEIRIPGHLLPHLKRIPFVFRFARHRLYLVQRDQRVAMSAGTAKMILEGALARLTNERGFPQFEVTVLPSRSVIEEIIGMASLQRLTIDIVPPNPDDTSSTERRILRRLSRWGAGREITAITAERGGRLMPDEELEAMVNVGARNGKVSASGYDRSGERRDVSTVDRPLSARAQVDPANETVLSVLSRIAVELDAQ